MAPKDTLLQQMKRNPRGDWQINQVRTLCEQHDIELIAPKRGDHYKAKSPLLREAQIIPAHRPIKPPYIRALVAMIELHEKLAQAQRGK